MTNRELITSLKDLGLSDSAILAVLSEQTTAAPAAPSAVEAPAPEAAPEPEAPAPAPAPSEDNDLDLVRQLIREAKTQEELLQLWKDWPEAHEQLKSSFTERRKQLGL